MEDLKSLFVPISKDVLEDLVQKTKDWALMHGAGIRSRGNFSEDSLDFAPFILTPTPYPKEQFRKAEGLQTILNELMHRVAHDRLFLTKNLKDVIQVDEFTGNLFKIYETVCEEGFTQRVSLGLFRSDYMVHSDASFSIKQVEFNTVASSFGGIATVTRLIDRYVLGQLGHGDKVGNLPQNDAIEGLCSGMLEAWKIYGKTQAVILFVVEDVTYNICDQRFHEFEINRLNADVKVLRRTLTQIAQNSVLNSRNELVIDGYEIAVVYFRAGYEPGHYPSKKEWDARLLVEKSLAIKCPSIQYHLAGTKKIQQALAKPGALEGFLGESSKIEAVRDVFTGLYSLDFDEAGEQAIQMALDEPEKYILKPQREGGGNNVHGIKIREAVLSMRDQKERLAWILMDKIKPPITQNYMIRPGNGNVPELENLVSELGIFGVIIGDTQNVMINKQVGYMLRTKKSTSDEGGVAAGHGALDSPYLIDTK